MSQRIEWVDTARGLGLMFVFVGHLHTPFITTWIYTFHMPLFFFLSGLVFSMHPFRKFFIKKVERLVVPYFVLGLGIYLFYACLYAFEHRGMADYMEMLRNLIEQKAFWTIWFLAALFLAELILWGLMKISKRKDVLALLSTLLMAATFVFYRMGGTTLYWCFDVACVAQFFVMLGYLFRSNYSKMEVMLSSKQRVVWMIVALLINVISGSLCIRLSGSSLDMSVGLYGNELLTIVSAVSGIAVIILLCQIISHTFLTYLGQNTMIFFAWHSRIIIVACGMAYGYLGIFQDSGIVSQLIYSVVTLILIITILYPVTEGIKHLSVRKYFGV